MASIWILERPHTASMILENKALWLKGSLFSVFRIKSRQEWQFSVYVSSNELCYLPLIFMYWLFLHYYYCVGKKFLRDICCLKIKASEKILLFKERPIKVFFEVSVAAADPCNLKFMPLLGSRIIPGCLHTATRHVVCPSGQRLLVRIAKCAKKRTYDCQT